MTVITIFIVCIVSVFLLTCIIAVIIGKHNQSIESFANPDHKNNKNSPLKLTAMTSIQPKSLIPKACSMLKSKDKNSSRLLKYSPIKESSIENSPQCYYEINSSDGGACLNRVGSMNLIESSHEPLIGSGIFSRICKYGDACKSTCEKVDYKTCIGTTKFHNKDNCIMPQHKEAMPCKDDECTVIPPPVIRKIVPKCTQEQMTCRSLNNINNPCAGYLERNKDIMTNACSLPEDTSCDTGLCGPCKNIIDMKCIAIEGNDQCVGSFIKNDPTNTCTLSKVTDCTVDNCTVNTSCDYDDSNKSICPACSLPGDSSTKYVAVLKKWRPNCDPQKDVLCTPPPCPDCTPEQTSCEKIEGNKDCQGNYRIVGDVKCKLPSGFCPYDSPNCKPTCVYGGNESCPITTCKLSTDTSSTSYYTKVLDVSKSSRTCVEMIPNNPCPTNSTTCGYCSDDQLKCTLPRYDRDCRGKLNQKKDTASRCEVDIQNLKDCIVTDTNICTPTGGIQVGNLSS